MPSCFSERILAPVRVMRARSSGLCGLWSEERALATRPKLGVLLAIMARESPTFAHIHCPSWNMTVMAVVPDTAVSTPARCVAVPTNLRCMMSKELVRASKGLDEKKLFWRTHTSGRLMRAYCETSSPLGPCPSKTAKRATLGSFPSLCMLRKESWFGLAGGRDERPCLDTHAYPRRNTRPDADPAAAPSAPAPAPAPAAAPVPDTPPAPAPARAWAFAPAPAPEGPPRGR
jgi:hypothetical protein